MLLSSKKTHLNFAILSKDFFLAVCELWCDELEVAVISYHCVNILMNLPTYGWRLCQNKLHKKVGVNM